jgi:hypothetical protein
MNEENKSMPNGQHQHEDLYSQNTEKTPQELPDYLEDEITPSPVASAWLSNPKNWLRLLIALLLLAGIFLTAPLYHTLKRWRATIILGDAEMAFAYGDSERGMSLIKQAVALAPGSRSARYAVELFNARQGDEASLKKILSRMGEGKSSTAELLGIAELEVRKGNVELVNKALGNLPNHLNAYQTLHLDLVRALILEREAGGDAAADVCLSAASTQKGENAARLKIRAATYLLLDRRGDRVREGIDLLFGVMREKKLASLSAGRILAGYCLHSNLKSPGIVTPQEALEVAHLLPLLPGHQSDDALLAADLEIYADPASKDAVVKRLTSEYQHSPRAAMLNFARWLNAKGLRDEVIAFAGSERPQNDTDWLLIVLDAKSAKGEWGSIAEMLDTPAGLGIPDAVKHLFLARIAMMTGKTAAAEEEWRSVSGSLHLEKPETLAYIAGYEEEIGATEQVRQVYRAMADRSATRVPGLIALIRSQPRTLDATKQIPLYEELLLAAPNLSDATGDLAYLKLLNNQDISWASSVAEKLRVTEPNSLARISVAALGRLKSGDPRAALALFESSHIDWSTAPDPWKAVYVSVLRAAGEKASADQMTETIHTSSLNPQELQLIAPLPVQPTKNP